MFNSSARWSDLHSIRLVGRTNTLSGCETLQNQRIGYQQKKASARSELSFLQLGWNLFWLCLNTALYPRCCSRSTGFANDWNVYHNSSWYSFLQQSTVMFSLVEVRSSLTKSEGNISQNWETQGLRKDRISYFKHDFDLRWSDSVIDVLLSTISIADKSSLGCDHFSIRGKLSPRNIPEAPATLTFGETVWSFIVQLQNFVQ